MSVKSKILIVEDEAPIRQGLVDVFTFHGYEVDEAETGNMGLEKAITGTYDMILLDVMLPGVDGFSICEEIRKKDRSQPVIMLTAKAADEDVISGLSLGADDYVTKPFSVEQLVLRVKAVLRRSNKEIEKFRTIAFKDHMKIDTVNLKADTDSDPVLFTRREIDMLSYLAQNNDRPVTREELLLKVWGYQNIDQIETRKVDIHIDKLRKKLEPDTANPKYLVTIRGEGYKLENME
jgi:two-component system response regulator RegX3